MVGAEVILTKTKEPTASFFYTDYMQLLLDDSTFLQCNIYDFIYGVDAKEYICRPFEGFPVHI